MTFKESIVRSARMFGKVLPTITGILILISLFNIYVSPSYFKTLFTGSAFDSVTGAFIGSVVAGNPVTSYLIAGDLLKQGISLIAVTSFIVSWVTVGVIQLPAEIQFLGKRFAIARNISAFVLSLLVAFATVFIMEVL